MSRSDGMFIAYCQVIVKEIPDWIILFTGLTLATPCSIMANDISGYGAVILPLEIPANLNADKVKLGDKLFHDTRLSGDNSISFWNQAERTPSLIPLASMVPRVVSIRQRYTNADYNLAQFRDGRTASLEDQIDGPTHNLVEMASNSIQCDRTG